MDSTLIKPRGRKDSQGSDKGALKEYLGVRQAKDMGRGRGSLIKGQDLQEYLTTSIKCVKLDLLAFDTLRNEIGPTDN